MTTVSGLLTKPGLGVWSARPDGRPPLLADLAYEVGVGDRHPHDVVATLDGYDGVGTVATYTVTYDGMAPGRGDRSCATPTTAVGACHSPRPGTGPCEACLRGV